MYDCRIVADSIGRHGIRLTTFCITYPEIAHADHTRHREQSFSVESNRAVRTERFVQMLRDDPFVPDPWLSAQKGMEGAAVNDSIGELATKEWLLLRSAVLERVSGTVLSQMSKQYVNRLFYPWKWITVVCSATSWSNFWKQRCHRAAQPELQKIAVQMCHMYHTTVPTLLEPGAWHLPFITEQDHGYVSEWYPETYWETLVKFSTARCAATSYANQFRYYTPEDEITRYDRLTKRDPGSWDPPHPSPAEHVAQCLETAERCRNFVGYRQHRLDIVDETATEFDYKGWLNNYYNGSPEMGHFGILADTAALQTRSLISG